MLHLGVNADEMIQIIHRQFAVLIDRMRARGVIVSESANDEMGAAAAARPVPATTNPLDYVEIRTILWVQECEHAASVFRFNYLIHSANGTSIESKAYVHDSAAATAVKWNYDCFMDWNGDFSSPII